MSELTKSILYIDPTPWSFEIRPKMIEKAIIFALSHGWNPNEKYKEMYLSMKKDQLYVLPKGVKFGHQDKNNPLNKTV